MPLRTIHERPNLPLGAFKKIADSLNSNDKKTDQSMQKEETQDSLDIQRELEAKFDELFGSIDDEDAEPDEMA